MPLFENVYFLNEGEQAEEYKAKKEAEKDIEENNDKDRFDNRYVKRHPGSKYTKEYLDANGRRTAPDGKAIEDLKRHSKSIKKLWDHSKQNPDQAHKREDDAYRSAGFSQKEIDKMNKFNYSDDDSSEAEANYMTNIRKTNRYKDSIRISGAMQAADALNRHMRRHPEQYKESGIFESVQFLNEMLFKKKDKKRTDSEKEDLLNKFNKLIKPHIPKITKIISNELKNTKYKDEAKHFHIRLNAYDAEYVEFDDSIYLNIYHADLHDIDPNNPREYDVVNGPAGKLCSDISNKVYDYIKNNITELPVRIEEFDGDWEDLCASIAVYSKDLEKDNK